MNKFPIPNAIVVPYAIVDTSTVLPATLSPDVLSDALTSQGGSVEHLRFESMMENLVEMYGGACATVQFNAGGDMGFFSPMNVYNAIKSKGEASWSVVCGDKDYGFIAVAKEDGSVELQHLLQERA